jgi:hypothetical protein
MCLAELLPKVLESNRGRRLASGPQQSHHFTKNPNPAIVDGGAMEKMFDEMAEALIVRPILHHERRETDFGIHGDVSIFRDSGLKIHCSPSQTAGEFAKMFRRSDYDDALAGLQSGSNKTRQTLIQSTI